MLTLTVKNSFDLGERNNHIRASWSKLVRRKQFRSSFRGGFGFQESTYNKFTGWHVHMHLLLDGFMDQRELARHWQEITGDSYIVDIRAITVERREQACYEAAKYPCKLADITNQPQLVEEYLTEFKGRRLMWAFGHCFGLMTAIEQEEKVAEREASRIEQEIVDGIERTCPHCGSINSLARAWSRWSLAGCQEVKRGWWIRGPAPGS